MIVRKKKELLISIINIKNFQIIHPLKAWQQKKQIINYFHDPDILCLKPKRRNRSGVDIRDKMVIDDEVWNVSNSVNKKEIEEKGN